MVARRIARGGNPAPGLEERRVGEREAIGVQRYGAAAADRHLRRARHDRRHRDDGEISRDERQLLGRRRRRSAVRRERGSR